MTSTIQIPNITINGDDYWINHTSQYNAMIGESISPLTIDLKGYPTSNTISIVDPSGDYYYTNNTITSEIINYSLTKNTNLTVKVNKMTEFWEVPRELSAQGVLQYPSSNFSITIPNNITEITERGLSNVCDSCSTITSVNFNNIEKISSYGLYNAFHYSSLSTIYNLNFTTIEASGLRECFYQCSSLTSVPSFSNLISVGSNGLYGCFRWCTSLITPPEFPNLTTINNSSLSYCFENCNKLTSLPSLTNVTSIKSSGLSDCFQSCSKITTAPSFAKLTSIESNGMSYCFATCTSLTTPPTFNNLTTIGTYGLSNCFISCTSLTTAPTFPSLTTIGMYGLQNCFQKTNITSLSFPALTSTSFGSYKNCFNNMLKNVTGCTVHFPSNLQSVIGSWSDVTNGFGGTNTTILFDLPATS